MSVGFGCGDFQLKAQNGAIVCGRSMEFPLEMNSKVHVFTRNDPYTCEAPDGTNGASWTSKYGYLGIFPLGLSNPDEGMNEKGLSFGFLTLKCSQYQSVSSSQMSMAIPIIEAGTWILGNFATVAEVKAALPSVRIWGKEVKPLGSVPGLHIALHDATGGNLVIEFINGEAVARENPVGVLTNDPPLDWQLTNLAQYNYLSPQAAPTAQINGVQIPSSGIGSGFIGLPGDWSSTSRFVRIATLVRFAVTPKTETEAVTLATHILNAVDLPAGLVIATELGKPCNEITRWAVIKDLTNKKFYFRSYNSMTLHEFNFDAIEFDKNASYKPITIASASLPAVVDVTKKLYIGNPEWHLYLNN